MEQEILTVVNPERVRTGSMKCLILLFCCMVSWNLAADELKIELSPAKPVQGEVFQAYVRIFTDKSDEPNISFSPIGLEVVGKVNQGISTRTIYANGKLSVTRELTFVYDFVANRTGTSYLRDINVQIGSNTIRHPNLAVTVLKEPEVMADVFVMADVPKKMLYIGEGVTVRYYLYSKVPVSNLDVKKYPKLNHFLKRFLQEPERSERVSVDDQVYLRTQIYAAKLFPEKTGELKVDSLSLTATYPSSRSNDPFGAFGLGREFKTRNLNSEVIKIDVRPVPAPVPADFTGLVGNHEFSLQASQTKLIVNEPLEVKLTVSGVGALENLEAPALLKNPALEEFETNGELKITDANLATKVFDYTYLAKGNVSLPAQELTLSYFDPVSEKYIPVQLKIPEVVVAGGQKDQEKKDVAVELKAPEKLRQQKIKSKEEFSPLILQKDIPWRVWLSEFNMGLAVIALFFSLGWLVHGHWKLGHNFVLKSEVPAVFKKDEFDLKEFIVWLSPLIAKSGKSPLAIMKDSDLSEDSKRYFIELLNANDLKDYSARKSQMVYRYHSSHFKELARYIKSVSHESRS
jgi:hypothetical protein